MESVPQAPMAKANPSRVVACIICFSMIREGVAAGMLPCDRSNLRRFARRKTIHTSGDARSCSVPIVWLQKFRHRLPYGRGSETITELRAQTTGLIRPLLQLK